MARKTVKVDQLQVGIFVELDLPWLKHNFLKNNFKIKNEKQLEEIRKLGIKEVGYDPLMSDVEPLPIDPSTAPEPEPTPSPPQVENLDAEAAEKKAKEAEKKVRVEKLKERRVSLGRCKKAYQNAVGSVSNIMKNLSSHPAAAVETARKLVDETVERLIGDQDAALQLVSMKGKNENSYYHAMNVFILSMMLGNHLKLSKTELQDLGTGALLHDLGHIDIPEKILRSTEPLSPSELALYQMHPSYGLKIAKQLGAFNDDILEIIGDHHEHIDGSGYPNQLRGLEISKLAMIVAIVNNYDNLCNNETGKTYTPHEAMSHMYVKQKHLFDEKILSLFITKMGVYPPGTVIRLVDGRTAIVISINPKALLHPNVMVYDRKIPAAEAPIIDLSDEEIKIEKSIRRTEVSPEMLAYFNLGENINYYVDPEKKQKA